MTTLLYIMFFSVLSPVIVFLCVKLGTFGYYKGKELAGKDKNKY